MKLLKTTFFLLIAFFIGFQASGQEDGKIDAKGLKIIKSYYKNDQTSRAITNAVSANDINDLVINAENRGKVDTYFSDRVKTYGITDQKSSGRCWLFASLNVMRPKVIEKLNLKDFEFSQNYSFFWDQLEKANLFLEGIIETRDLPLNDRKVEWLLKNPIGDGGVWNGFVNVVEKYGLVPSDAMPETHSSENTRMMTRMIALKIKENALQLREMNKEGKKFKELRSEKTKMLGEVYRMLAINLGEPPESFTWRYEDKEGNISEEKTYTPQQFYKELVGIDLRDYVLLMDDPSREYNKLYEIEYDRNTQEGLNWKYINIPVGIIKDCALKSIKDNEAMYFSCDVGKFLDRKNGYLDIRHYDYESIYQTQFGMDKKERIQTFSSGSSHGMSLMAVDIDKEGNINKWLLENSWGSSGFDGGFLIMTDEWFDEYMFRVVVNKKYVPEDVLKILDQEAILLPPWDPMFAPVQ